MRLFILLICLYISIAFFYAFELACYHKAPEKLNGYDWRKILLWPFWFLWLLLIKGLPLVVRTVLWVVLMVISPKKYRQEE